MLLTDGYPDTTESETLSRLNELIASASRDVVLHTVVFECDDSRAQKLMDTIASLSRGTCTRYTKANTEQQTRCRTAGGEQTWFELRDIVEERASIRLKLNPPPPPEPEVTPEAPLHFKPDPESESIAPALPTDARTDVDTAQDNHEVAAPPTVIRHHAAHTVADSMVGSLFDSSGFLGGAAAVAAVLSRGGSPTPKEEAGTKEADALPVPSLRMESYVSDETGQPLEEPENLPSGEVSHLQEASQTEDALVWDPVVGGYFRCAVTPVSSHQQAHEGGPAITLGGFRAIYPAGHPTRGGLEVVIAPEDVIA